MRNTGNEESGFDIGEGARKMAPTPKGGSRRANCPILTPIMHRGQRREACVGG